MTKPWWWSNGVRPVVLCNTGNHDCDGRVLYLAAVIDEENGVRALFEDEQDARDDDPMSETGPMSWGVVYRDGRIARLKKLVGCAQANLVSDFRTNVVVDADTGDEQERES